MGEKLKERIAKRKQDREDQLRIRQEREKRRLEEERLLKLKREEEEEKRRLADEEKKKQAIQNMSASYGGYLARSDKQRGNRRQTEREKKRKILTDRRRPLNVDHLSGDKIKDKAKELQMYYASLEEERYNFETIVDRQKYDINQLRNRVQQYMGKYAKSKDSKGIKTFSSVGAKKNVFK